MLLPVFFFFFIREGKDIFPDVGEKYLQLQVQLFLKKDGKWGLTLKMRRMRQDESDVPVLSQRCSYFNRIKVDSQTPQSSEQLSSDKSSPVWLQTLKENKRWMEDEKEGGRQEGGGWRWEGETFFFSIFPSVVSSHKRVPLIPGVLSTYLRDEIKTLCELY